MSVTVTHWIARAVLVISAFLNGVCVVGLRNVSVQLPTAVKPGDAAKLVCDYDLEGDQLYTVKWYKGRHEFFRYVPKDFPRTKVFPLDGVLVNVNSSGEKQVVIENVTTSMAGKYRCEVSADAPSFHTEISAGHMNVIDPPREGLLTLKLDKSRYAVNDVLKANCTAPPSEPPVNISWFINDQWVDPANVSVKTSTMDSFDGTGRQRVISHLDLKVSGSTFRHGRLDIQCRATLWSVYAEKTNVDVQEDLPRQASVLQAADSSCCWLSGSWLVPGLALLHHVPALIRHLIPDGRLAPVR